VKRVLAAALLGVCASLSGCAAPLAQQPGTTAQDAAARQLLVMLRMPPPHFRAGTAYDGNYPADSGRAARRRVAQALAREHRLRLVDEWPMPVIGVDCFVMERAADEPAAPLLARLARDPRVAWAQPVELFHALDAGDPLYPLQPGARFWHLGALHRISTGRGVRVAVVDSGVDASHPDLAGQVDQQENFVDAGPVPAEAHGTAVAGILAARAGNGIGIAGVAPQARLMALRGCWQAPGQPALCSSFTLAKALNFALLHEARVINLSLAGPSDRLLQALLSAAAARGTAVVGALDPAHPADTFPTAAPGVLAVVAQAAGPARPLPNALRAPGTDIPTCLPGARWGFVSGASFAAAHVSGLIALLAQLQPSASAEQLKRNIVLAHDGPVLAHATNRAPDPGADASIDACATIARAAGACTCSCPSTGASRASLSR
jgi:subtilisin family serine protease